jgi:hypothetical protein
MASTRKKVLHGLACFVDGLPIPIPVLQSLVERGWVVADEVMCRVEFTLTASGSAADRAIRKLKDFEFASQDLTERLRKLSPRVTDQDMMAVAKMKAEAEEIAAVVAEVKKKLGLES